MNYTDLLTLTDTLRLWYLASSLCRNIINAQMLGVFFYLYVKAASYR